MHGTKDSETAVSDLTDEAGAPEIEVTEEMIAAGETVILSCGLHPSVAAATWEADLAVSVYQAMAALACPKPSPASVSKVGCGIVCGHQGHIFSTALLVPDRTRLPEVSAYVEANRPSILFELGIGCLRLALEAIQVRATTYCRARWSRYTISR